LSSTQQIGGQPKTQRRSKNGRRPGRHASKNRRIEKLRRGELPGAREQSRDSAIIPHLQFGLWRKMTTKTKIVIHLLTSQLFQPMMKSLNPLHHRLLLLSGRISMTTMMLQHNQPMNMVSVFHAFQPDTTTESFAHLQSHSTKTR
jgi:hypothetical protein